MKKNKLIPLSITTLLALCACNQNNELNASDNTNTKIAAKQSFQCKSANRDLTCLEEACVFAGGVFSQDLKKCTCESGKMFAIEDSMPQCKPVLINNSCAENKNGFQNLLATPDDFNANCGSFWASDSSTSIYIDFTNASDQDRTFFSKWADSQLKNEFKYNFWKSNFLLSKQIIIGGSINNNSMFIQGLLNPVNLQNEVGEYLQTLTIEPYYFPNAIDAISFLTNNNQKTDVNAAIQKLEKIHPAVAKLLTIYQTLSADLKYTTQSPYQEGCIRSCIATSEKVAIDNTSAWFTKYYFNGILYRSELRLADESGHIIATLLLADHAGSIAIEFNRDETGLLLQTNGFDFQGNILFSKTNNNLNELKNEQQEFEKTTNQADLKIGLCEDNISFTEFRKANLNNVILKGPAHNDFYGWGESHTKSDFWQSRFSLNEYGKLDLTGDMQHAVKVAQVLFDSSTENQSIGVIPMSTTACLNKNIFNNFRENFKKSGARVINFSALDPMDEFSCKEKMKNHPMLQAPTENIWVAAAGNEGLNFSPGCPQNLHGQQNLIIVAANRGNQMHPSSNYGDNVADIAAPGENLKTNGWGTSFSAPRVSVVAAKIFDQFPQLTPAQVKQAILLGADIPKSPLPVLSKGILNETNAILIAQTIANSTDLTESLKTIFCKKSFLSCPMLNLKLKINSVLKQQGGL